MLRNPPTKIRTGTTQGVVIITLLLSLFAFSGVDSRGPTHEISSVKTELVARTKSCVRRTTFYAVGGQQKCVFNFYLLCEIDFLRVQDNRIKTKIAATARQIPEVKKFFSRYHQISSSRSVEEHFNNTLPG